MQCYFELLYLSRRYIMAMNSLTGIVWCGGPHLFSMSIFLFIFPFQVIPLGTEFSHRTSHAIIVISTLSLALGGGPDLQKPIIFSYPIYMSIMIWFMMAGTHSAPIKPVEKIPRTFGEKRRVSLLLERHTLCGLCGVKIPGFEECFY